ncbi:BnaCnng45700D [Brassica napus]|uniref:BnaCnng45700D protein n=1 Tax=Brassica napus TaxID=3708 RepID=A0A078JHX9_BRANA|nr:BnaCnng45700D [Brassica napus]
MDFASLFFFSTVVLIDEYAETAMKKILLELKPCNLIMYLTKLQELYISLHKILLAHASATNLCKKSQKLSRQQPDSMTSLLDGLARILKR